MFQQKKYVPVKEVFSSEIVDITSQYALIDELVNFVPETGDAQVPHAHSKYSDTLMESLLLKLKPTIEYVTGLELFPTYSYYRVYRAGMDLKPHVDRPSCEISATVCFNFNYQGAEVDWPMYIEGNPVVLQPGDAIIYRGCEVEHWRDKLEIPQLGYHIQGFFHYVDSAGPYAEYKLDKRDYIGQVKNNSFKSTVLPNKKYISNIN